MEPIFERGLDFMRNALLGYTGFVGSNLYDQLDKEGLECYNSKNFSDLKGHFDNVYCCCVPGVKYIANAKPLEDLQNILKILTKLKEITCDNFFLVSSQDCNANTFSNENFFDIPPTKYGTHRLIFEKYCQDFFNCYTLRIGCLFGNNLRKNIIYDLMIGHFLENIKEDYTMQLYCLDNLKHDFEMLKTRDIRVLNRFSEPVWISDIINVFNKCGYNYSFNLKKNIDKCYNNTGMLYSSEYQLSLLEEFIWKFKHSSTP